MGLMFLACDPSTPNFYYTKNGLKYQYHDIVGEGKTVAVGDYLTVNIEYRTNKDSVLYASRIEKFNGIDVIHLGKPSIEGGIEEGFAQLIEGDSVTFFIDAEKFFHSYLNQMIPDFLSKQDEIRITLRLIRIETPEDYFKRLDEEEKLAELQEFQIIDSIVNSWSLAGDSIQEINGIYLVKGKEVSVDTIFYGDNVAVFLKGYLADGTVIYDNSMNEYPDEYKVGVKGQNLEGVKIALLNLCIGQSAKVVIPSLLGVGEQLTKNGMFPANTPLIFEIQTVEPKD